MRYVRGPEFLDALERLAAALGDRRYDAVVGIKRSGLFPAVFLSHKLGAPMFCDAELDAMPPKLARVLLVDAVARSGRTMERVRRRLVQSGKCVETAVLFKENDTSYGVDHFLEKHEALVHFFYERLPWTPDQDGDQRVG